MIVTLLFTTLTFITATSYLTAKQQREVSPAWASKNSFPSPMPVIPSPVYCSKHPQKCTKKMNIAEQYWYNNVLNDIIKSIGANVHLELPPKSNSVRPEAWFAFWRRFADILRVKEYPQPPNRRERNQWNAYWKGVIRYGQYWPDHPPPPNYPQLKGYRAWVDEFKPCIGAGCELGQGATHAKHGVKRFMKKMKKGIKKALHLGGTADTRHQGQEMRRREEFLASQSQGIGQGQSMDLSRQSRFTGQTQGYNQLGPRVPPPQSSYEYNRQQSTPYHGQTSIDIDRQASLNINRGGPYYGDTGRQGSYSAEINRQATLNYQPYSSHQQGGPYGRQGAFDVSGQINLDVTRQGSPPPPSPHHHHRHYDVGQQQQQQRYGDLSRSTSYSSQRDYGHPFDYPFDPFASVNRGQGHYSSHGYNEDPFASINRQFGGSYSGSSGGFCAGGKGQSGSFAPPPSSTVFHGHHGQLGPVYRSTPAHPTHPHDSTKLRYYIERNGMLTEVSPEIFHEMRCGSPQMTCCAPHCDESIHKHHHHQGTTSGTTQRYGTSQGQPIQGHRSGTWGPSHPTSGTSTGTGTITSTGNAPSEGGLWSTITGFWNAPADWHERERRWKHRHGQGQQSGRHEGHAHEQSHYGQTQSSQSHWSSQQHGQQQQRQPTGQVSYERSVTYNQNQPAQYGYGQSSYNRQASWNSPYQQQQQQQPSRQASWNVTTSNQPMGRNVSVERSVSYSSGSSGQAPPSSYSYNVQQGQRGQIGGAGGVQQQQQAVPPSSYSYNQQR